MKKELIIKVFADSAEEAVIDDGKKLKVYVREPAMQGSANKAVCLILARYFDCDLKKVVITRGHTSPSKVVIIYD